MFPPMANASRMAWEYSVNRAGRHSLLIFKHLGHGFHNVAPSRIPKLRIRIGQRIQRATQVVGQPLTPAQRKIRNLGMSALGIATAAHVLAVTWDADYPLSMAAIGAFRTTSTFLTGWVRYGVNMLP
jgi:hypothetical protein